MIKSKFFTVLIFLLLSSSLRASDFEVGETFPSPVVRREERKSLVATDYGEISAVDIGDGTRSEPYHIQFITLEPNSLFLPVLLHADVVFYVHTGRGRLQWGDDDEMRKVDLRRGDVYRLHSGAVFYMHSNLETEREKLRIFAFFANPKDELYKREIGPYSSIIDLVRGFDRKVLREAFKVSEEAIEEMVSGMRPPQIVHAVQSEKKKKGFWEMEARFLKSFSEGRHSIENNKKKQSKVYNIFDEKPDFENCNGWSLTVSKKNLHLLKGSEVSLFMVNLTKGSMMGPHWNPMANEVAIVLKGRGMVRVVHSNEKNSSSSTRFRVEEGDVFAVPRFHPMVQMSFNNGSMVFMGFSTSTRRNHPQFLAGKMSVLRALDEEVMAASFNVNASVVDQILRMQDESVILECVSCAEEEERVMEEETEREREEARRREEEEARKREEEEERERREEEEARKEEEKARREEEERKRREEEEEEARREEEERKRREEEEARREEAERKRREEEEEQQRREEEEEQQRREEEERREWEEEEARKQEEERKRRQREKEEEEERREEEREWEEEEARKQEEERQRRQREKEEEEEEARKEEEERERGKQKRKKGKEDGI